MQGLTSLPRPATIRRCLAALLAVGVIAVPPGLNGSRNFAQDKAAKLPAVGSWARYEFDFERDGNAAKLNYQATVSAVGRVIENDQPCRWIELKFDVPDQPDQAKAIYIYKLLVSEKDLLESENPMQHAFRAWVNIDGGPVSPVSNRLDFSFAEYLLAMPGPLAHSKSFNEPKDVEYQKGKLESARAREGRLEIPEPNDGASPVAKIVKSYTIWLHPGLPIGFAEASVRHERLEGAKQVVRAAATFRLQDAGSDAKSELPESN